MNIAFFRTLSIIVLLGTIASCSSESMDESIPAASTDYIVDNNYNYIAVELQVVELVNQHRISEGLNTLEIINHISNVAEDHDDYMISVNTLTHALFAQREENLKTTLNAVSVGENIAYNYSTAQSVVDAWLASLPHKANIEGNYTHCGISIRENAEGKKYFTFLFIRK